MAADADTETDADWQRTWHDLWEILGCKWTFHVIRALSIESRGFNELERYIDGITATMLSRRLDQLEDESIIAKSTELTSPPSSTYRLTETGEELAQLLRKIEKLNPDRK